LTEGELGRIDNSRRPFWEAITEALESDNFQRAVYAKLAGDIAIRLGCSQPAVLEQSAYPNVMLIRDYQDYRIKPHPDGQPRVVTMQFYLPAKMGRTILAHRSISGSRSRSVSLVANSRRSNASRLSPTAPMRSPSTTAPRGRVITGGS
jgi:hypothetical protein